MANAVMKSGDDISNILHDLAEQIKASHSDLSSLVFVGILTAGFPLAERLSRLIEKSDNIQIPVGKLDIALYRDDLFSRDGFVTIRESDIPFSIEGKTLILVDDVLFYGRTIRAALNALLDFGRPSSIELAVLVDRGHRQLPIVANYVGCSLDTDVSDHVHVGLYEIDGEDHISLEKK